MLDWLVGVLTPIFGGMGVSPTDVQTYVEMLSGYIYGIVGILAAVIVVMVAAHWLARKGTRHVVRWVAGVAGVLGIAGLLTSAAYGPLYNNLAPIMNGGATVSQESVDASKDVIRAIGDDGMVLLKNDGVLPLEEGSNLNVFGWASTNPIFGGTGSGSSDSSDAVGILDSLEMAGFNLNGDITAMYNEYSPTRNLGGNVISVTYTDWSLPEPPIEWYTDELMAGATEFSDTAVIVLARSGGEGQDLPRDMHAVIHGTYDDVRQTAANGNEQYNYFACNYTNNSDAYDDFDEGEHYLQLSNTEEAMVEEVCSNFDHVVLVVNANNPMELGWTEQYPQIGAIILAPGTGSTAMEALGRIMDGEVNPSGRTIETYLYDLTTAPSYNNSGAFNYTNVEQFQADNLVDPAFQGAVSFVDYVEGIYVGYRYYETAYAEAEAGNMDFDYDANVQFPFGHGESYTTFDQEIQNFSQGDGSVSFDVTVTNTGTVAGKDVVELYFTPPYENGGIEKAAVNLVDFGKTKLLEPGESQTVHFDVALEDLASYDSQGIKASGNGGYVLEAGEYTLSVRSDSHTVIDEQAFTVDADVDYSVGGRSSDVNVANNQFQDYSVGSVTYLSRADGFANYAEATAAPADDAYLIDDETLAFITDKSVAHYDPTRYDDPADVMPTTGASNGLTLADLTGAPYDDPRWEDLLDQLTVDDMALLVNLGGFQTAAIESVGKVAALDSDGTAGLNDWYIGVYGTPYPSETLISQTWSKEIAAMVGSAYADEFADVAVYGWYGPAMNTHRSAFCGRNFEYFSEDGVLAGYIASAEVNAAAEKGVYAFIKHFVMNDQETNRCAVLLTYSDEQAIREVYMKPFEIVVKNFEFDAGKPLAVMSSFNFIGDVWSGANPYLLDGVLRGEWGFKGMVLTDWHGGYGYMTTDDSVRNGNDLMLGFMQNAQDALTDLESPTLVQALRKASHNILYTVGNSGYYTNPTEQGGMDNMTKTFLGIDGGIAVVGLAALALVVRRWKAKQAA